MKEASGLLGSIRAGKLWQAMESSQTHSKDFARSIDCGQCFGLENNLQHFHSVSPVTVIFFMVHSG